MTSKGILRLILILISPLLFLGFFLSITKNVNAQQCPGLTPCVRYVAQCDHYYIPDGYSCSDYPCSSVFPTKCRWTDPPQSNNPNYMFSCCPPTPTPGPPPPGGACPGLSRCNWEVYGQICESSDTVNGATCETPCSEYGQSFPFPLPYKCQNYAVDIRPDFYCCRFPGTGAPFPTPPDDGRPTPTPPQNATPLPYVPCNDTRDNEFHSLRPYQASPCNQDLEDLALYCGNSITLIDDIDITFNLPPMRECEGPDDFDCCVPIGNGRVSCRYEVENDYDISIDLVGADFPIMGYTEPSADNIGSGDPEVTNSIRPAELWGGADETLSIQARVNEYVSWYFNGVNQRAEYNELDVEKNCIGETTSREGICRYTTRYFNPLAYNFCLQNIPGWDFDGRGGCPQLQACCTGPVDKEVNMLDRDRLVNFSGPLKKLLPIRIQHEERIEEIRQSRNSRHNQTASCIYGLSIGRFDIGAWPGACYIKNIFNTILDPINDLPTPEIKDEVRLYDWDPHSPPLEENFQNGNWHDFLISYRRWRGQSCGYVVMPEIRGFALQFLPIQLRQVIETLNSIFAGKGIFICFDNPFRPNYWSSTFENIPFSSTEDRKGKTEIDAITITQPRNENFRLIVIEITDMIPADLFFAHMEEVVELADDLQETFVYLGAYDSSLEFSRIAPPYTDPYCDLINVRSNPGDDLFPGTITAHIYYRGIGECEFFDGTGEGGQYCESLGGECVSRNSDCSTCYGNLDCPSGEICGVNCSSSDFPTNNACTANGGSCRPDSWSCSRYVEPNDCGSGYVCGEGCSPSCTSAPPQTCTIQVRPVLDLLTYTPLADEAWARTVAGPVSIVKRFFPLNGVPGAMDLFTDIPAATDVEYVIDHPHIIGDPSTQRSGSELYFPHIGGIHEYLLHGIQTALRPQGYGYPITYGSRGLPPGVPTPTPGGPTTCWSGDMSDLSSNPECRIRNSNLSQYMGTLMVDIFEHAGNTYGVPPDLVAAMMYAEGGFEPRTMASNCYRPYTNANILEASICEGEFNNCSPLTNPLPCNYDPNSATCTNPPDGTHYGPYQQCANNYNPCNFYDSTMAMARWLSQVNNRSHWPHRPASCLGYDLVNTPITGTSCTTSSWSCEDAIRGILNYRGPGACDANENYLCDALSAYGMCFSQCTF